MPRRRPLDYAERVPPLQTTPETFWVNLFRVELGRIGNTKAAYLRQRLVRKFLSELRITAVELDRGLIKEALRHHLSSYPPLQRNLLMALFKDWATLPLCQPPSSDSESRKARVSARSPKGRIAAG